MLHAWETWEPGHVYRVPVVRGTWWSWTRDWVVLGPRHEDAEFIDFPHQHYHLDPRFVPLTVWRDAQESASGLRRILGAPLMNGLNPTHEWSPPEPLGVRRRKMLRSVPEWMIAGAFNAAPWEAKLRAAYADDRLRDGVCPHRGADLRGMEPDEHGCVVCPLHGLRWNVATGRSA